MGLGVFGLEAGLLAFISVMAFGSAIALFGLKADKLPKGGGETRHLWS